MRVGLLSSLLECKIVSIQSESCGRIYLFRQRASGGGIRKRRYDEEEGAHSPLHSCALELQMMDAVSVLDNGGRKADRQSTRQCLIRVVQLGRNLSF